MKKIITQNFNNAKRFYSVKEAAQLLQVSTNTLYKYLNIGEIGYKRIGQGRIKIPFGELLPYLPFQDTISDEKTVKSYTPQNIPQTYDNTYLPVQKNNVEERSLTITKSVGDIVFFRLFKVSFVIGLGLIYIFISGLNYFNHETADPILKLMVHILPYALILSGIFNLIGFIKYPYGLKWNTPIHIFQAIVIGVLSILSAVSKDYGIFIFTSAYLGLLIEHIIRGIKTGDSENTFLKAMAKYLLALTIIGGVVSIFGVGEHSSVYPGWSVVVSEGNIYPVGLIPAAILLIFFLNPNWEKRRTAYLLTLPLGVFLIYIGTVISRLFHFDISYLAFLCGIYTLFLGVWYFCDIEIKEKRTRYIFPTFLWVGLSAVLGVYAIKNYQDRQIFKTEIRLEKVSQEIINKVETMFSHQLPTIRAYVTSDETKKAVTANDHELAGEIVKVIYDKFEDVNRVVLYNEQGVAIGVYPRNSMIEGTNFSSRSYFSETKRTYRGTISPVFRGLTDRDIVIQTEPVFSDNLFAGMIGLAYSTSEINNIFDDFSSDNYGFYALDRNGKIVFSSYDLPEAVAAVDNSYRDDKEIVSKKYARMPDWTVYVSSSYDLAFREMSPICIIVSVGIAANAFFSIVLGFSMALDVRSDNFKKEDKAIKLQNGTLIGVT